MLVVAALGGNALLKRGEPLTARTQRANVRIAAEGLAAIIRAGHDLVITHGNGPQVGCWHCERRPTNLTNPIHWICWARKPKG